MYTVYALYFSDGTVYVGMTENPSKVTTNFSQTHPSDSPSNTPDIEIP